MCEMEMIGFTLPKQHAVSNRKQWPDLNPTGLKRPSLNPTTHQSKRKTNDARNKDKRVAVNDNGDRSSSTRKGTEILLKRQSDGSLPAEPAAKKPHNALTTAKIHTLPTTEIMRYIDRTNVSSPQEKRTDSNLQASKIGKRATQPNQAVAPGELHNFQTEALEELSDNRRDWNETCPGNDTPSISDGSSIELDCDEKSEQSETEAHSQLLTIDRLRSENLALQRELDALRGRLYPPIIPPRRRTIYRVICDCRLPVQFAYYDDIPSFVGLGNFGHVVGRSGFVPPSAQNNHSYGQSVVLAVFKTYRCSQSKPFVKTDPSSSLESRAEDINPRQGGESMAIIGEVPQKIFAKMLSEAGVSEHLSKITGNKEISAPYVFFHQNREAFRLSAARERSRLPLEVNVIMEYLESFQAEFDYADKLCGQGQVCLETIHYLFKPGQLIVQGPLRDDSLAAYTESYLQNGHDLGTFEIRARCWRYDGKFYLHRWTITLNLSRPHEVTSILDMEILPLDQAPESFQESLRLRGWEFWQCRKRRYVRYDSKVSYDVRMNDLRYMIDYDEWNLYQQGQAKSSAKDQSTNKNEKEYMTPEQMVQNEPPAADLLYLLPSMIMGFHMLNKKWQLLNVAGISDVKWNKKAFESLVVDIDTKEFIQALVTQRLSLDQSTDLIEGKGNSLVILLHGGPGTGKTLTAESVAELAEKPLYRVTCGDIGTDPVAVERHLQNVLYLGKAWGCVVLLDEADIFLEERRSHDLSRNALVSVFLRALEYYDGILILTTNRVGTFDEAFKSRIQLSVRYNNLSEQQRLKIWENFFKRLEDIDEEHVDVSDLRRHGRELAKHKMNGRQIRNSLTNARQLASYKEERMDMAHLRRAIDVFIKFEDYTREIKQGITDDDIARECGVR